MYENNKLYFCVILGSKAGILPKDAMKSKASMTGGLVGQSEHLILPSVPPVVTMILTLFSVMVSWQGPVSFHWGGGGGLGGFGFCHNKMNLFFPPPPSNWQSIFCIPPFTLCSTWKSSDYVRISFFFWSHLGGKGLKHKIKMKAIVSHNKENFL